MLHHADLLLITVDLRLIIQRYAYRDRLTTQRFGNAVAIVANLDIAVSGHLTDVEVTAIEVRIRQRLQMFLFQCKADPEYAPVIIRNNRLQSGCIFWQLADFSANSDGVIVKKMNVNGT